MFSDWETVIFILQHGISFNQCWVFGTRLAVVRRNLISFSFLSSAQRFQTLRCSDIAGAHVLPVSSNHSWNFLKELVKKIVLKSHTLFTFQATEWKSWVNYILSALKSSDNISNNITYYYYYMLCSQIEVPEHSNCRLVPYWREFLGVSGSRTWSDTPFANT